MISSANDSTRRIASRDHGDHRAATRLDLFHIGHDFVVDEPLRHDEDARRLLIDQGDRAMFHFRSRIAFRMDVADFLEFQGPFQRGREIVLPAQVEEVVEVAVFPRDLANMIVDLQDFADLVGQPAQMDR